jgi:aryl-alcohol dehydrogenase-like predicted oxidoreductase
MELRALGSTGLSVSALGLGTVKIGRNTGVKYPGGEGFALPDDDAVRALLDTARELGINLLDTAPAYGSSEERLGRLMGRREDWLLCSKTGEIFEQGASRYDYSAAHTRASVEASLRRLRASHLDLLLIHSDGDDERILTQTPVLETLRALQARGLVCALGMSTKSVAGGLLAVRELDVVMVTHNLQYQGEQAVLDAARAAGKGVLIKKGLNSGHLALSPGADPVTEALRFVFAAPAVSSVIVGTLNPAHLRHNAQALAAALAAAANRASASP